ncbi:hypothetical protein GCM10010435_83150 [Winogradskya consettensis]|uniref:FAD-binding domain-containing protein n=1 Tax=Winogradskya consettensis TaxID=113560 RepID=A0A919T0Y3_9ACTN|nr:FAD-dependent monooxygenase [Actinoplanes consettensis]GIM82312.1 hypothetical protein Aco04nite_80950 [Actinoplanes consettensis]
MDTDVVIAGAGPAGLRLATELAIAGVRANVVETLETRSGQSKATNLQPRTAEIFALRALFAGVDDQSIGRVEGGGRRNWQLARFEQDDDSVTVYGPEQLRARFLIGCDGGRSTVRKLLGVEFDTCA